MGLDNPIHIFLLLIVLLLVFGAKRLPEIGRSLGDGMRGFKESLSGELPRESSQLTETDAIASYSTVETPETVSRRDGAEHATTPRAAA
jgi:sec-independent protein translocase protein TatA